MLLAAIAQSVGGDVTPAQISGRLNAAGIRTPSGHLWAQWNDEVAYLAIKYEELTEADSEVTGGS